MIAFQIKRPLRLTAEIPIESSDGPAGILTMIGRIIPAGTEVRIITVRLRSLRRINS